MKELVCHGEMVLVSSCDATSVAYHPGPGLVVVSDRDDGVVENMTVHGDRGEMSVWVERVTGETENI